jgi:GNAT superfamily N-acetyltransferase
MQTTLEQQSSYSEELVVRQALYADRDGIAKIAITSAIDMTPGDVYAQHAEENRCRLEHSCRRNIDWRIARTSLLVHGAQRVLVATLSDPATLVREEDHVVGYMFATTAVTGFYREPLDHILIHGAAVDESVRNKGIGQALLGAICDWSKEVSLPVHAHVADTNTPMLTLLKKNDFTSQGTSGPTDQNPVTYYIMVRKAPEVVPV